MVGRGERRRDQRYRFQRPATLVRGRSTSLVLTEDVGFRGVNLRTEAPPPLRELVQLRFQLPPDGQDLELHGMAVWSGGPGVVGAMRGVGVQFFAVPPEAQRRWNEFVRWVARTKLEAEEEVPAGEGEPEPVRRSHQRIVAELQVRVRTAQGPEVLTTHYVSRRGMFLQTTRKVKVGTRLELEVLHPTSGAALPVQAVVRHRGDRAARPGIGVELLGLDDRHRDQFMEFVLASLEPAEEDLFAGLDLGGS